MTALKVASMSLAGYQRPRLWAIVEDFPRNAMGKVQKARIRALLQKEELPLFTL